LPGASEAQTNDTAAWLPAESESAKTIDRSALFFDPENIDANVVIERTDGPLTDVDREAVETLAAALQDEDHIEGTPTVEESESGPALLVHVTMNPGKGGWETLREVAADIRTLGGELPEGLSLYVAGPAGAAADQMEAFSGSTGSCSSPPWVWSSSCCLVDTSDRRRCAMSLAELVITSVRLEGRTQSEVARDYRGSRRPTAPSPPPSTPPS